MRAKNICPHQQQNQRQLPPQADYRRHFFPLPVFSRDSILHGRFSIRQDYNANSSITTPVFFKDYDDLLRRGQFHFPPQLYGLL
jgi:hypothetical protein